MALADFVTTVRLSVPTTVLVFCDIDLTVYLSELDVTLLAFTTYFVAADCWSVFLFYMKLKRSGCTVVVELFLISEAGRLLNKSVVFS